MFENMNKRVGMILKDIALKDKKISITELSRRLTVEYCKNISKDGNFIKLNNGSEYEFSDEDIKRYYEEPGIDNIDKIQTKDGKKLIFLYFLPYAKLQRYLSGEVALPIWVLATFSRHFNISLDDIIYRVFEKESLKWEVSDKSFINEKESPTKAYLKSEFKEKSENFAFDPNQQKDLFSPLFKNGESELNYHTIHLSLNKDSEEEIQTGTIKFYHDKEKDICCAEAILTNSQGFKSKYIGFVLLLNSTKENGNCWVFIRRENDAELCVISFRLGRSNGDIRIAEVLTIRSNDSNPTILRMILSKEVINKKDIRYFKGHLTLNPTNIMLSDDDLKNLKNYFSVNPKETDVQIKSDLDDHFRDIDKETKKEFKAVLDAIKPDDIGKMVYIDYQKRSGGTKTVNLLNDNPLIASWLRSRNELSVKYNALCAELDTDVENMYNLLKK